MRISKWVTAVILVWCGLAGATVHNVTCTGNISDDLNGLSLADGDTIVVSAGTCTLDAVVFFTNRVDLVGAGDDATYISSSVNRVIDFNVTASSCPDDIGYTISNLNMANDSNVGAAFAGMLRLRGTCKGWRIHHNTYTDEDNANFGYNQGDNYGLIDHNTVNLDGGYGWSIDHANWNGGIWGDDSWSEPMNWNSVEFVYLEDNVINGPEIGNTQFVDVYGGGRYIARYNTMNNTNLSGHGTDSGRRRRSQRGFAAYGNTMNQDSSYSTCIQVRGGTAMIYDNVVTGGYPSSCVALRTYRIGTNYTPWGQCDSTDDYVCLTESNVACSGPSDSSCAGGLGFCMGPADFANADDCRDGVAQGQVADLSSQHAKEPVYIFGNSGMGEPAKTADVFAEDDYYLEQVGAECTEGVTVGMDTDRCGTCVAGTGYWATDTKKMYQCQASNMWTVYYQEFEYPHPLTVEDPCE